MSSNSKHLYFQESAIEIVSFLTGFTLRPLVVPVCRPPPAGAPTLGNRLVPRPIPCDFAECSEATIVALSGFNPPL